MPKDTTEQLREQLAAQLRELGASVYELEKGKPSLLVGFKRRNSIIYVGDKKAPAEWETWQGSKVHAVTSLTEACQVMGYRLRVERDASFTESEETTNRKSFSRGMGKAKKATAS